MLIIIMVIFCICGNVYSFYEETFDEENEEYVETAGSASVPNINARAAILYDVTYDRVLYEKNSKQKRANASTTKMITAIVAYEEGNLDDIVTISLKAATTGGSTINLKKDDKITLDDLLKGLLVHSGNDAAIAIAEHISGTVEEFVKLMNEKLEEIGARDSHFVTPHGLDAENHYSTAYDLALIAKELLKNDYLRDIVSKQTVNLKINGVTRTIGTTNEMLSLYEGADGIKTGYTGDAGRCLITSVTKNGRKLVSVVLGCDSKKNRTNDSIKLINYGFEKFKVVNFEKYIRKNICISVAKSEGEIYRITKNIDFCYPLSESEISKIEIKYDVAQNLVAPLYKGQTIANAKIYLDNNLIGDIDYLLPENILKKSWKQYFETIIFNALNLTKTVGLN